PSKTCCEGVMDCMARLHGFWWDHPLLGTKLEAIPTGDDIRYYLRDFERIFSRFADFLGDRLSKNRRDLYDKIMANAPKLWEIRVLQDQAGRRNLTLIHGDAHFWSFLYPREEGGNVYIIDWQFWRVWVPTDDLAYMIALHWYPEQRQAL